MLIRTHKHSINHRAEIEASALCGCFHCCASFRPAEIKDWLDDNRTALCPRCGIDAVIGDASGLPVMTVDFLKQMNRHWF
ncbi:cytoplasmic protein [Rhizobium vallis]|uniref:Cytoplasmic protein n=1 Tax=Rhizobium vallis TaxID=634290 RepID=A0A432PAE4_9HYPH|nr:cytoplasmic protein [Rhizobium vallis]